MASDAAAGTTSSSSGSTVPSWLWRVGALGAGGAALYVAIKALRRYSSNGVEEPPPEFLCPITRELMTRPVFTSDGHTYERLAIIRWLQAHSTSPSTGEQLPDRDIRPNRLLRTQIAEFRERNGMEPLPEWLPDPVETVASILPQDNPAHGHAHGHAHGAHNAHFGGHAHGYGGAGGMPPQGVPAGMAFPNGNGGFGVTPPVPGDPIDAFRQPPVNAEATIKMIQVILRLLPFVASSAEMGLGMPARSAREHTMVVVTKIAQEPRVFQYLLQQLAHGVEVQRHVSLGMYWTSEEGFRVPGEWPPAILAVRHADVTQVERIVHGPGFSPSTAEARSMLIEAIWCKESNRMTTLLLSRGVPVDAIDSLGCPVLHNAAAKGDVALVRLVLERGALVTGRCKAGSTALHHAASWGRAEVVAVLRQAGANPLAIRGPGRTPLFEACMFGQPEAARALLVPVEGQQPRAALEMADEQGLDPLNMAARAGSIDTIKILLEFGAPLGTRTMDGALATHQAAYSGHIEAVEYLLDTHPDHFPLEATNTNNDTVLQIAATHGDMQLVKKLIRRGANVNTSDREGFTPLHSAIWRRFFEVATYLIEQGADPHARTSNRSTALHLASWHGDVNVARRLIDCGAAVDARTRDGDTPLHQAAFNGHAHVVLELLARFGTELIPAAIGRADGQQERYINACKADGSTALHLAASKGRDAIVDILIAEGCDFNVRDRQDMTAANVAEASGHAAISLKIQQAARRANNA
eukprot:m.57504 g.57504  ORF g.57504 m.57504 type:complete len:752 (-) comp7767_c1_seq1:69-2324(-)